MCMSARVCDWIETRLPLVLSGLDVQLNFYFSPQKPHKCPVEECGRSFSRGSHLRRHALLHNGAKTFRSARHYCALY